MGWRPRPLLMPGMWLVGLGGLLLLLVLAALLLR